MKAKLSLENLKSKIQKLENELSNVKTECDELRTISQNRYSSITQLIDILVESGQFVETNQLIELKNYV